MFVLEFEKPLFEFAYDKPHCDLLFAFPPTFRSSTPSAISGMSCFMFHKTYPSDLLVTACLEATRGLSIRIFVFLDVVYNNVKQRFGHLLFRDA